jgi:pimeloyl-ACP methyl ester carboxylesterase
VVLPVVFVHALRTSRTMWREQVAAVEAAGHRALAIDLPGHGARIGEELTVDGAVEAVRAGIESVAGPAPAGEVPAGAASAGGAEGRALVVGLSLGGYIGIAHAARHPEQVAGLVAAACCTRPLRTVVAGWEAVSRGLLRLPDHGAAFNAFVVGRMLPPAAMADAGAGGWSLDVMTSALRAMAGADPVGDLARVRAPVWLVNGRFDHFRGEERRFLAACRDGRLVVVPRAPHFVSLVRPTRFSRTVLEALAVLEGQSASAQARTPPTMPASLGTTTTSSPSLSSTLAVMRRELPPPR